MWTIKGASPTTYKIFSLACHGKLSFCGEPVPLELLDVQEQLDVENCW